MDWKTYYERFYYLSNSTQISYLSRLTDYGPSNEIAEVAAQLMDQKAAARLVRKALDAGVRFSAEDMPMLVDALDRETLNEVVRRSRCVFTNEQLDEIYCAVSDEVFEEAARRSGIHPYGCAVYDEPDEDEDADEDADEDESDGESRRDTHGGGFFSALLSWLLSGAESDDESSDDDETCSRGGSSGGKRTCSRGGKCDGDCEHCPPHYGYRYGRWYYGHCHDYGCEFGGNKGDGSRD